MIEIYVITNKVNGKLYVGQSTNVHKRFMSHIYFGKTLVDKVIRKYGKQNFYYDIVDCALTNEDADLLEQQWIADLHTMVPEGYNVSPGGMGGHLRGATPWNKGKPSPFRGVPRDEEIVEKIRLANTGKRHTEEHKAKISAAKKGNSCGVGYKLTEEHKAKISVAKRGRKLTEEHKAKISATLKGRRQTEEAKAKMSAAKKGKSLNVIRTQEAINKQKETMLAFFDSQEGKEYKKNASEKMKRIWEERRRLNNTHLGV